MASLIHDTSPILQHSLQQSHNKGLYYGFSDAILSNYIRLFRLPFLADSDSQNGMPQAGEVRTYMYVAETIT